MKQHKWYKEIKCFIDGGNVERRNINGDTWFPIDDIGEFSIDYNEFRIKPTPKEPQYLYFYEAGGMISCHKEKIEGWDILGKIKLEQDDD